MPLLRDSATPAGLTVTAYAGDDGSPTSVGVGTAAGSGTLAFAPAPSAATVEPIPGGTPASKLQAVAFAEEAVARQTALGATLEADGDIGAACVPSPGYVHMDAMAFGMGCCCLQVTFQARDLDESTFLYDQLAIIAPLMVRRLAATRPRGPWHHAIAVGARADARTRVCVSVRSSLSSRRWR